MSVDSLREVRDSLNELLRLHQLNLELLETLETAMFWLQDFGKKHDIQIPNRDKINSLITKADNLLAEITTTPYWRSSDDSYHDNDNRRKVNRT